MNYPNYVIQMSSIPASECLEFQHRYGWPHPELSPWSLIGVSDLTTPVIRVPHYHPDHHGQELPVVAIRASAFSGNETVTDILLPSSIYHLDARAFAGCKSLKNLILPKGIQKIDEGTFADCTSLENIYYEGTPEDWRNIQIVFQKHEVDFGTLLPGTPVQSIDAERWIHIPGNEAFFNANIHFYCPCLD